MKPDQNERLCIFGCYVDTELYPRNRTLIDALGGLFSSTVEVRPAKKLSRTIEHGKKRGNGDLLNSTCYYLFAFFSLLRQARHVRSAHVVFIPYPAYIDVLFLKLLLFRHSKPKLIVDAFLCLHDTLVYDRKIIKPKGTLARLVSRLESGTLRSADLLFIDTPQQRNQLINSYRLSRSGIVVTPVGIDENVWFPLDALPLKRKFQLLFWGTFIPLHGVDTIIASAKILEDLHPELEIKIIGDGQTADAIEAQLALLKLRNVVWDRRLVGSEELRSNVEMAHCILGIFGMSEKAANVVPYKVYQAMAANRIVITRSGPALAEIAREVQDSAGLILVPPGSPEELSSAISMVYQNYSDICRQLKTRQIYDMTMSNRVLQAAVAAGVESLSLDSQKL